MRRALREHWPEGLCEALGLGLFMVSACVFDVLLEGNGQPLRGAISDPLLRRSLMGLAMGATAVALISSPFGQRSGAHINPAVTLTFLRLGKVRPPDAALYAIFQLAGAAAGVGLCALLFGGRLADPAVAYVATLPGEGGPAVAFAAEAVISFILMSTVLLFSNHPRLMRFTPLAAGTLVGLFITLEAPLSGMSMNPARTMASALYAGRWDSFWLYVAAPLLGMLAAAELHLRVKGATGTWCAKLHHANSRRCIFLCTAPG